MPSGSSPPPRGPSPQADQRLITLSRTASHRYRCREISSDDLRQEAYLVMHAAYKQFGLTDEGKLLSLARNHLRTLVRRERRNTHAPLPRGLSAATPEPSDQIDTLDILKRAMDQADLPERQHLVLDLTYWQSLSDVEIAETLHITPVAVRQVRHRALKKLRKILT